MSKHKKRVSLAQQTPQVPETDQAAAAEAVEPPATESDISFGEIDGESQSSADSERAAGSQPDEVVGIDRHPLFWFVLGALTVGIIVLLGLLLMNARAASLSPLPTPTQGTSIVVARATTKPTLAPTATRPATAMPPNATVAVRPTPTMPDFSAVMTSVAIDHDSIARINVTDTKKLMGAGAAVLVDVRNGYSYQEQHARGAINVPVEETESRLSELPKDKTIIFYCS